MKTKKGTRLTIILMLVMMLFSTFSMPPKAATAATVDTIKVSVKHPALDTIKLKWSAVSGANGYNIYVSSDDGQQYKLAASVNNTAVVFDQLTRDKSYRFKVMAYKIKSGIKSEFASSAEVISNANRIGIDVSRYQDEIDWKKVKESGVEFAMIKALETYHDKGVYSFYQDPEFINHITNATANKVPVGVYIYTRATSVKEAKEDAKRIISLIKGYKVTYPVVIDIEDINVYEKLSKETNTAIANAFCKEIKAAGYTPMVYSGCNFSQTYLDLNKIDYDLWIAHHSTDESVVNNYYHFKEDAAHYPYTRMWQFSSSLPVEGISDPTVDHNYEFDIKESVTGFTHIDMTTGAIRIKPMQRTRVRR